MKSWIVIDLDGTLCNIDHRAHLAQQGLWEDFHSMIGSDTLNEDVAAIMHDGGMVIWHLLALTGRPERYREQTEAWLKKYDIWPEQLVMRPDEDYSSDVDLKPKLLAEFFDGIEIAKEEVLFILEDRDKIVEAFRNLGFNCWQVRNGLY